MMEAILLVALFAACLWLAYACLRHVFRAVPSPKAQVSAPPRPEERSTPLR
jgi:hypothetical protein